MKQLDIWLDGHRVGTLDGTDRRRPTVVYDAAWQASPSSTPISLSMPVARREHSGSPVEATLWGLLPDNDRVLDRWAARFGCSALDVFGLLTGVGGDVAGAMQ